MLNQIDFRHILVSLLDTRGRLSRGGLWLTYFGALGFALVTLPLLALFAFLLVIVWVPAMVVLLLGLIRRLHDRGKSGWLLLPVYGAWLLSVLIVFGFGVPPGEGSLGFIAVVAMGLFFVGGLWLLIELLLLPGTPGPNRFGPDPLQSEGGGALRQALALLGRR